MTDKHYFLGSNSGSGFFSLYGELSTDTIDRFYILKGGPGCGKSSFMKKIASHASESGYSVEYVHCSGDPDSLDGIIIPALHLAYADGTAPHVLEPLYPALRESYIDLGAFYDSSSIQTQRETLLKLNKQYKKLYAQAYSLLSSLGPISENIRARLLDENILQKIARRTEGIASREFKKHRGNSFGARKYFLSAHTCKGLVSFAPDMLKPFSRVYCLDNRYGFAFTMLEQLKNLAQDFSLQVVICPDPLQPKYIAHLLIPELSLAFTSIQFKHAYRHIRLDAMVEKSLKTEHRNSIKHLENSYKNILDEATLCLSKAKALHDELEAVYNGHVDFNGVYELATKYCEAISAN